ncbi:MAG: tetratricopeptide repeat protein [Ignavibacteria bacterium]|nr:tetratricopeptide repeat protein [Ignavibacteria bacterium]
MLRSASRRLALLIAVLTLLLSATPVAAQSSAADQRIRLAQTYERAGRYEEAIRLYSELYGEDSTNVVYFDGLRRMYLQLKQHEEAIRLIRQRRAANPGDISLTAQLGSVLYKSGLESEAFAEWEQAVAADSLSPATYRMVAGAMMENRLLEKTTDLYRRARSATGKPELFTLEMAQLFSATMNYTGATREYSDWLFINPGQLSFVQQRMASIAAKEEGRKEAIAELKHLVAGEPTIQHLELLAWLYLEGKEYHEAHEVYREIDQVSGAEGARVYAFAEQAFREKAYHAAAEAYEEAIETPVSANRLPGALYGYAGCLTELAAMADTIDRAETNPDDRMTLYEEGIAKFREVIAAYPGTEYAARSHFQIGLIYYERFFDLEQALQSFLAVESALPGETTVSYAVSLKIGEVLTARGDTTNAAVRFRQVAEAPGALPDQQDEGTFRLAELAFFRGDFGRADTLLGGLTLNLRVDYANDALRLQAFLLENMKTAGEALRGFAEAAYLAKMRHDAEAIARLESVVDSNPKALLVDDALLLAGHLQERTGLYAEAIGTFKRLLDEFATSSIALDEAWFAIAEIYHYRLQDPVNASSAYESLLTDFPGSLHADEARRRIRHLRGESL